MAKDKPTTEATEEAEDEEFPELDETKTVESDEEEFPELSGESSEDDEDEGYSDEEDDELNESDDDSDNDDSDDTSEEDELNGDNDETPEGSDSEITGEIPELSEKDVKGATFQEICGTIARALRTSPLNKQNCRLRVVSPGKTAVIYQGMVGNVWARIRANGVYTVYRHSLATALKEHPQTKALFKDV